MKRFSAIIFDMDGVIVDSEPLHEQAFLEIFEEMGYGETHGMDFAEFYGRSDRALWFAFVEKHKPVQTLAGLIDWKQRRFLELLTQKKPVFAGVPLLVERMAQRYKLAVASGSYHPVIDEVLAMENLRRFFSAVVSVQDVTHGKPAPDVFLRAADLLAVPAKACCVIEDSAAGVDAALAAGMQVVAITNTLAAEKLSRATSVVGSYQEIERLFLEPE